MWYTHRTFQENTDDFKKMCIFITELNKKHVCEWSLGRLFAWMYGRWSEESQNAELFCKHAELFFDYTDVLCGLVITEDAGEEYYLLADQNPFVLTKMIEFLENGGNFEKNYKIVVREKDDCQVQILQRAGFEVCGKGDTTYTYKVENIVLKDAVLPQGYQLTSQKEFTDYRAMELQRFTAFNPNGIFDEQCDKAYLFSRQNPLIDLAFSILLLNDTNEPVSSCIGYLDRSNLTMEVEVVCTKKEYEGKGFAKTDISERIRRSIAMGIKEVSISGWNDITRHLYSSFGRCETIQKVCYEK